jgi:transcription-repair coupling factor (superfamily II helicase)
MSIIATPPVDRLTVRTYVTPQDPILVREACCARSTAAAKPTTWPRA